MSTLVEKRSCGVSFTVVDPAHYPFGREAFDDEKPIKDEFWSDIGAKELVVDVGALWGHIMWRSAEANGWPERLRIRSEVLYDGTDYPEELSKEVFGERYPVQTLAFSTLDLALADVLGRVTRIKVDVEGAELGVIRGGLETLKRHKPMLLIEEHSEVYAYCKEHHTRETIIALLKSHGYQVTERRYDFPDLSFRDMLIAVPHGS